MLSNVRSTGDVLPDGRTCLRVLTLAGVVVLTVPASAADGVAQELAPVVVTGSNIPRPESLTASPIQILGARDLQRSGYTTVWQALNDVTANGQGALSQNFGGSFGASGISLRGLNVGATLVLIDGYRMASYPADDDVQRAFVDLASIPLEAVDRIEILKDGASAIYGSDAVAGVVNVVLLKTFNGTRLVADAGISSRGDGASRRLAFTSGKGDLASDGYNAYVSAEVRGQNVIRFSDRGGNLTRTDFTSSGGYDVTPGVPNPLNGGLPDSATGYVTNPAGSITGFMPGCDAARLNAGRCSFSNTWAQVQPKADMYSVLSRFTLALAPRWQASVQASYAGNKSDVAGPLGATFPGGYQGVAIGPGRPPTLTSPLPPTTISSRNPSFPAGTGGTEGVLHYSFADIGPMTIANDARSTRLIAAIDGEAAGWGIGAAAGTTRVRLTLRGMNLINPANLQQALDSATVPYLVGQRNDPGVLSFIAPEVETTQYSRLDFLRLSGRTELSRLSGGPIQVSLGGELQSRRKEALSPDAAASGQIDTFGNSYVIGSQHVASVYTELLAPVTKELTLEAAGRYDHYNLSGGRLSPKVGLSWKVIPEFGLRATAGRGFRAPGPAENGTAGTTFVAGTSSDPVLCPSGDPAQAGVFPSQCALRAATLITANRNLAPETSTSYGIGFVVRPVDEIGVTLDYFSIDVRNQIVIGSNQVAVRGTNLTPIPQLQADGTFVSVAPPVAPIAYYQLGYINANSTKTSGVDLHVRARRRLNDLGTLSSDLTLTYVLKYDLEVEGVVYHLAGTHGPFSVSGDSGNPRMRVSWVNTFERERWSVTGTLNYIGRFDLTDPSAGLNDCAAGLSIGAGHSPYANQIQSGIIPSGVSCRVAAFTTFNLVAAFDLTKQWRLQASVLNLFDAGAPADWATYGGAGRPYNRVLHSAGGVGRMFGVEARYVF